MTRKLLQGIERAEAEVFAVGQLARQLVKEHRIPAYEMAVKHGYSPDGTYGLQLDIFAPDAQALRDWAQALSADVTAKVGTSEYGADEQVSLAAETTVGSVPVRVWVISLDADEIARYRAEGGERP